MSRHLQRIAESATGASILTTAANAVQVLDFSPITLLHMTGGSWTLVLLPPGQYEGQQKTVGVLWNGDEGWTYFSGTTDGQNPNDQLIDWYGGHDGIDMANPGCGVTVVWVSGMWRPVQLWGGASWD